MTKTMNELVFKYFDGNKKFSCRYIFNIRNTFALMRQTIPMVFIQEKGADPLVEIIKFSKDFNISDDNMSKKSVGRGQNDNIDKALCKAREKGQWIVIQNCHIDSSFYPILEYRMNETINAIKQSENKKKKKDEEDEEEEDEQKLRVDPKFRLYLSLKATDNFPVSILHNSIKICCEIPKSIRENVIRNYNQVEKN